MLRVTFCSLFVFALASFSNAQLTINNDSDCRVLVKTAQSDNCSTCNPSAPQLLNPGDSYSHPFSGACPDPWLAVKFRVFSNFGAISNGRDYNPFITCGANVQATCNGDPVTVTWLMPNAGSPVVEVFIDN